MAGTQKGREIRIYFLNCEAELKRRIEEERNQSSQDRQRVNSLGHL
jgi:phage anti-repressor protein